MKVSPGVLYDRWLGVWTQSVLVAGGAERRISQAVLITDVLCKAPHVACIQSVVKLVHCTSFSTLSGYSHCTVQ